MRALVTLWLCAACACYAQSQAPTQIKVVTDDNYPPYLFRTEGGELRGIVKDKWALWSARTGVPVVLEGTTWTRAQEMARRGEADVIDVIALTEARRALYEFSPAYGSVDARVYFHESVSGINDAASLRGFTIGAKEASACAKWITDRSPTHIRDYPTSESLVRAATAGEVRVFCLDAPTARYFLFKAGQAGHFRETEPLYSASLHWAVRSGQVALRDFIQAGFAGIPPSELDAIDSRWMGNPVGLPLDSRYVVYFVIAVAALVAAAALLLLWNRSLRVRVAARTLELRNALTRIARQAEDARELYDNAPCGYHSLDAEGFYVEVNDTELTWLGMNRDEVVGKKKFSDFLSDAGREAFQTHFPRFLGQGEVRDLEYELVRKDGSTMRVLLSSTLMRDAAGRPIRTNATVYDITARAAAEAQVAHMANHDVLTGLPNRSLLNDRLEQAVARAHRTDTMLAVILIDLDRFKTLNDSLGPGGGDRLLKAVGQRLAQAVREGDTLSRVGGDGFVVVQPEAASAPAVAAAATALIEAIGKPLDFDGNEVHVGASLGIALYPNDGLTADALLRNAETAMLHAKQAGRANFQFFARHMNAAAHERIALEGALRRGLENGEFDVHYQPIYDLRTLEIKGFEALLRWRPAGRDPVPTPVFIAIAEEAGLIVPLGELVLREALLRARRWQANRPELRIAVNVSAYQLARPDFYDHLEALVREAGVDPGALEIEVTETVIIESKGPVRETIDRISRMGARIVIDDFGTGYAGLAYLKRLPANKLKIDQSFVRNLPRDRGDAAIVAAIIAMARGLGMEVVAEGVETEEQRLELERLGCECAQGFLWSHALARQGAERLLASDPSADAAVAD
jgi:diguanylate cyclase (GGDEF)-like protein/PAS domain S-box-containing protein